ncbi:MAG: alpha-amylase family glycosyl hydrolase, partial [Chitinophagaceae bacterium]
MSRLPRPFQTLPSLMASTMYEVNIRQYTPEGTFSAFAAHLPRLQDMGVDILWFMPITPISLLNRQGTLGSYYACSDYVSVNPEFGSLADFQQLVSQAQERGMRVIIDWVANHTGWDHVWTKSHPGYYKKNAAGQFYDKNGWHDVIDLNYYDAALRKEMIHSMQFWIEQCGIDGFRCDMAHLVPLDFWKQARNQLDTLKPLIWLGETEDISYLQVFDCCYSWSWMHNTLHFFKGEIGLSQLRNVLQRYQKDFPVDTLQLYFTTNHDENS